MHGVQKDEEEAAARLLCSEDKPAQLPQPPPQLPLAVAARLRRLEATWSVVLSRATARMQERADWRAAERDGVRRAMSKWKQFTAAMAPQTAGPLKACTSSSSLMSCAGCGMMVRGSAFSSHVREECRVRLRALLAPDEEAPWSRVSGSSRAALPSAELASMVVTRGEYLLTSRGLRVRGIFKCVEELP